MLIDQNSTLTEEQWQLHILAAAKATDAALAENLLFPELGWLKCLARGQRIETLDEMKEKHPFPILTDEPALKRKGLSLRGIFGRLYSCDPGNTHLGSGHCFIWGYTATRHWVLVNMTVSLVGKTQIPKDLSVRYCTFAEIFTLVSAGGTMSLQRVLGTFSDCASSIMHAATCTQQSADLYKARVARIWWSAENTFVSAGSTKTNRVEIPAEQVYDPAAILLAPYTIEGTNVKGELIIRALVREHEFLCASCAQIEDKRLGDLDTEPTCSFCRKS